MARRARTLMIVFIYRLCDRYKNHHLSFGSMCNVSEARRHGRLEEPFGHFTHKCTLLRHLTRPEFNAYRFGIEGCSMA